MDSFISILTIETFYEVNRCCSNALIFIFLLLFILPTCLSSLLLFFFVFFYLSFDMRFISLLVLFLSWNSFFVFHGFLFSSAYFLNLLSWKELMLFPSILFSLLFFVNFPIASFFLFASFFLIFTFFLFSLALFLLCLSFYHYSQPSDVKPFEWPSAPTGIYWWRSKY